MKHRSHKKSISHSSTWYCTWYQVKVESREQALRLYRIYKSNEAIERINIFGRKIIQRKFIKYNNQH